MSGLDTLFPRKTDFWINQGWRAGYRLAILDDVALYEYEMPNGTTALRLVGPGSGDEKTIAYKSLSKRWLEHLIKEDVEWTGTPQQGGEVPSAGYVLWLRREKKKSK